MATLREIVYNIKNLAEGGSSIAEDTKLSDLQVEFLVHSYRANLLMNYTNSGRNVHPQTLQNHKLTTDSDNAVKLALPAVVQFDKLRAVKKIRYEASGGGSEYVSLQLADDAIYDEFNRFTNAQKKAYLKDGDLQLYNWNLDTGELIEVEAVFFNPTEIIDADTGTAFDRDTDHYPMPPELIPVLTKQILANEYRVVTSVIEDDNIDGQAVQEELQGQVRKR